MELLRIEYETGYMELIVGAFFPCKMPVARKIAPLINISYKSVEMARYRLRKKIDLPPETTLTDYLCNL